MTEAQRKLILNLTIAGGSEQALADSFGIPRSQLPGHALDLLRLAYQELLPADVEHAMLLNYRFGITPAHTPILNHLLVSDWHTQHENIALAIENLRDPSSVEYVYQATFLKLPYLDYDDGMALARKCTWALARIGTTSAIEKLHRLAAGENQTVARYARKRLPP